MSSTPELTKVIDDLTPHERKRLVAYLQDILSDRNKPLKPSNSAAVAVPPPEPPPKAANALWYYIHHTDSVINTLIDRHIRPAAKANLDYRLVEIEADLKQYQADPTYRRNIDAIVASYAHRIKRHLLVEVPADDDEYDIQLD